MSITGSMFLSKHAIKDSVLLRYFRKWRQKKLWMCSVLKSNQHLITSLFTSHLFIDVFSCNSPELGFSCPFSIIFSHDNVPCFLCLSCHLVIVSRLCLSLPLAAFVSPIFRFLRGWVWLLSDQGITPCFVLQHLHALMSLEQRTQPAKPSNVPDWHLTW